MLVYGNVLQFVGSDAFRAITGAIHGWLTEQLGQDVSRAEILRPGSWKGDVERKSAWLRAYAAKNGDPEMYAWRLKHTDTEVTGRQWLVEIGLKKERDVIDLSCIVQTDEMSVLITEPVAASRPRLIKYILENLQRAKDARLVAGTPGVAFKTVGDSSDSYRGLLAEIDKPGRDHPIVLLSPDSDGEYLINPLHLQDALLGLAQVVRVDPNFDSWDMEETLGRKFSAWGGAVNVIRGPGREGAARSSLALSHEIEGWGSKQHERVAAILARVTHMTNVPRLRKHIRPDGVARLSMFRHMTQKHKDLLGESGSDQKMLELYKEELDEMIEQNQRLQGERDDKEFGILQVQEDVERLDQALREERYKNSQLMRRSADEASPSTGSALFLDLACRGDEPTPEECLEAIQQAFPNNVEILESAYDAARDCARFDSGRRLLRLLKTLCTDYIENMEKGGDNAARKCFTADEYAATESEGTQNNTEARKKRTFNHNGVELEMYRHLKIGKADDVRKSIRVYFEWLPSEKKVVIGHCGKHLPIISH